MRKNKFFLIFIVTLLGGFVSNIHQANADALEGFAQTANVTGGEGGTHLTVTSCDPGTGQNSLRWAIAQSYTRYITFTPGLNCTITWTLASGVTYVNYPNMTIDGVGAKVTISGMSISIHKSNETAIQNVIIRNLTFADDLPDRQAILMDYGSSRVWIDHNTFYNNSVGYTGQGVYISDNTGGTTPTYSTVSWNHFKAPNVKSTVIGQQKSAIPSGIRTSYHHNWFDGVSARNPKVAGEGVVVHFWNNYVSSWKEYGSGINDGANFLAENNIYYNSFIDPNKNNTNAAIIPDYGVPATGPNDAYWSAKSVTARNNLLTSAPGVAVPTIRTVGTFPMSMLNYTVYPETANDVLKAKIMAGAGANNPDGSDTTPPTIAQVTAVPSVSRDNTPNYTFSSTEAGTITYTNCPSATTATTSGNNTITLNTLTRGTHGNCSLVVRDASNNPSSSLSINSFIISYASDLNQDRSVNVLDFGLLHNNYGTTNVAGDVNYDGTVNVLDFGVLHTEYGGVV